MSLELEQKMEAILFAAGEPVELERLAEALGIDRTAARQQAECLMARLTQQGSPLQVLSLDGKYQLATRPEYAGVIQAATDWKRQQPLSQAAMEVLAVVAYNQPVTRAFVDQVRGGGQCRGSVHPGGKGAAGGGRKAGTARQAHCLPHWRHLFAHVWAPLPG